MKKHFILHVNLMISLIIVLGFVFSAVITSNSYSHIIEDDIQNISKLTSTNIYSEIKNELTKPVFVSLTMANDSFLKDWLDHEEGNNIAQTKKLQNYLTELKDKYHYTSVFLVSQKTMNYYFYQGILKKVNERTPHDQWYFDFIKEDLSYKLDVDTDEAKKNTLTVFINCKMLDKNNNLMAVVGVGVQMNVIQSLLSRFEKDYNLEAFLIDADGLVQVHTDKRKIEHENIFDGTLKNQKNNITKNLTSMYICKYEQNDQNNFLISRYIDDLDWYLIIKKDSSILKRSFTEQLIKDAAIIIILVFLLLIIIKYLIDHYKKFIIMLEKLDELTKLPNRKVFNERLTQAIQEHRQTGSGFFVFIFDIDHFKTLNDTHGHLFGDRILVQIAELSMGLLTPPDLVARWGGDEFAGILCATAEQAEEITAQLVKEAAKIHMPSDNQITISLGLTQIQDEDSFDSLLSRVDKALYEAKSLGRNQTFRL